MRQNIKIYCNGAFLDTDSNTSIRLNRSLYDPTRLSTTASEYSYSFTLPATPANNKAFGFANSIDTNHKFVKRFEGKLYGDGVLLFDGTILLNGYDAEERQYSCNLVSVKVNTVEDIFGEDTMYDLEWYEPYSGTPSINAYNASGDSAVYYPLVAYGVFEKKPVHADEVANDYTDRLLLDDTTLFYHETFVPSVNYLDTVRRCFAQKGYTLQGDVFNDPVLKDMYLSVSIPSDQIPIYNLANPKIGSVDISCNFYNIWQRQSGNQTVTSQALGITHTLDYPYARVARGRGIGGVQLGTTGEIFQFQEVQYFNMLRNDGNFSQVTENIDSYLFDAGEQCVVVPADGAYRIDLEVTASLDTSWNNGQVKTVKEWYVTNGIEEYDTTLTQNITETCPIEIQLVRNIDDHDLELIKGRSTPVYTQTATTDADTTNVVTCSPHERLFRSERVTKYFDADRVGIRDYINQLGYVTTTADDIMAYDPMINPNFICGFSSYGGKTVSVIKDGASWYRGESVVRHALYEQSGYTWMTSSGNSATTYHENDYPNAPTSTVSINGNTLSGHVYCTVWLNKNDLLTLECLLRSYKEQENSTGMDNKYKVNVSARLKMDALTPNDYNAAKETGLGYESPSQFDTNLRIGNFLSSGETMASFVNNFIKTFNLDYMQDGNTVTLTRGRVNMSDVRDFVDIDGRVAWYDTKWEKIEYPRSMAVKYTIDTDEWGAWTTVPYEERNNYKWKDFVDGGYDVIELDPNSSSNNEITNALSYCWYQPFTLVEYDNQGHESGATGLDLPCIAKYSVMAEGANYDDAMKEDSWSMKMRAWFRGSATGKSVKIQNENEYAEIYVPEGNFGDSVMNYKFEDGSLLRRYFNVPNDISIEKVEAELYLSPIEYQRLANGADVKFNDTLWTVSDLSGFDPAGENTTKLTLIKKGL